MLNILYQDLKDADSFRESDPIHTLINRLLALVEYESHSRNVHVPIEDLMHMDIVFEIGDANSENDMFRAAHLISRLYYNKMLNGTGHFNLIIMDEGRELFSQTTTGFGESAVKKMFALARKMNIGFIVATQEPKSVSTTIKANVHTMIAFITSSFASYTTYWGWEGYEFLSSMIDIVTQALVGRGRRG